ncbi:MAG TPA: methylated-DNA--[protein]-cysteine S-methyltransferase [Roseiflexaceae bacterium]|nr:methylated-DNA--[protein]-cysteine S-methyltransferase [Roseiflexaceae bacterium]HMP42372.1 methylated-DNA--[protein]-cysteine S-methyltransferase [Roseiflexaceae bacterium]
MTPATNLPHAVICSTRLATPLGSLVAAASDRGICMLEFADPQRLPAQLAMLQRLSGMPVIPGEHPYLEQLHHELACYLAGQLTQFSVPLDSYGTAFQQRVWAAVAAVPYGGTSSYRAIASALGAPHAARAVGHANGRNRLAILIPCHRLIGADGKLIGYGGGIAVKRALLQLERHGRLSSEGHND